MTRSILIAALASSTAMSPPAFAQTPPSAVSDDRSPVLDGYAPDADEIIVTGTILGAEARNLEAQRRANAHQLWNETLHLAFDNPKLSDPTLRLAEFDYEARTIDGSIETFQKYELYVDTILNASEAILDVSPTKEWDIAVRFQLNPHRDYLLSQYFQKSGYLDQYTPAFQTFLKNALAAPYQVPPPPPNLARIDAPDKKAKKRA